MSNQQESASGQATKRLIDNPAIEVDDITGMYPEKYLQEQGITQILNVDAKMASGFSVKEFYADLEALGIPAGNVNIGFCG